MKAYILLILNKTWYLRVFHSPLLFELQTGRRRRQQHFEELNVRINLHPSVLSPRTQEQWVEQLEKEKMCVRVCACTCVNGPLGPAL